MTDAALHTEAVRRDAFDAAPATFTSRDFPLNAWYAAMRTSELVHAPFGRRVGERNIVFYRRSDNVPVALEDACWHRLVPLSEGRLFGDDIVCPYHGLAFNSEGRCVHMPSQDTINPAAAVRRYPVLDHDGFVWVWLGDPAGADPAALPDLHWHDDAAWAGGGATIHMQCNYKLVVDNLMDLTHETFVHAGSLGQREVAEMPFDVTHSDTSTTVTRWMIDVDPPPFLARQLEWKLGRTPGRVDRWQVITFHAPSTIEIDVGIALTGTGAPEGDRSQGISGRVLNTITPETGRTSHYHWAYVRDFRLEDDWMTRDLVASVKKVFAEDEHILALQQAAIDAHPDKAFYNVNIDAGAVWARRLIDAMVAAEQPPA